MREAASNWAAYVPDLPVCITTGKTLEETKRNIPEAIEFHLEAMAEVGESMPEPSTEVEFIDLRPWLNRQRLLVVPRALKTRTGASADSPAIGGANHPAAPLRA